MVQALPSGLVYICLKGSLCLVLPAFLTLGWVGIGKGISIGAGKSTAAGKSESGANIEILGFIKF
jgi:hypothetical protein